MAFLAAALPAAIGAVGSIIGGNKAAKAQQAAAQQALTGYNYLSTNPLISATQSGAQQAATSQAGVNGDINSLLTSPDQNNPAFKNYLNSTGYNFQLKQGTDAIAGNAAAKGILNSGATAKALTGYGQSLASTTFNNYLGQLGGLSGLYGKTVDQGLTATGQVGAAGNIGGGNAAQQTAGAGQSQANGIGGAFGAAANAAPGIVSGFSNFFSSPASNPGAMGLY